MAVVCVAAPMLVLCGYIASNSEVTAGVTPDPLDYSFVWQLLTVLQAIDALSVEDDSGLTPPQVLP